MLSKKKKIFVLVGMVALLVVTGCLNIFLNNKAEQANANEGNVTYASFFAAHRAERESTRSATMLYLDAIIQNEASSEEAVRDAESQKLAITKSMETELVLESLIKALGFEDAVVTGSTNNINVIVKSADMTEAQAAQILDIIVRETDKTATNVRVVPIS